MIEKYLKILEEISLKDLIDIYFLGNADAFIDALTKKGEIIPNQLLVRMSSIGFTQSVIKYLSSFSDQKVLDFILKMFNNHIKKEGNKYIWYPDTEELIPIFEYDNYDNVITLLDGEKLRINCKQIWNLLSDDNSEKLKKIIPANSVTYVEMCETLKSTYTELFYKEVYNKVIQNIANFLEIDKKSIKKTKKDLTNEWTMDLTNVMNDWVSDTISLANDEAGNYMHYIWENPSVGYALSFRGIVEFPNAINNSNDMEKFKNLFNMRISKLIDDEIQKHSDQ
jgi:hypothetical protein